MVKCVLDDSINIGLANTTKNVVEHRKSIHSVAIESIWPTETISKPVIVSTYKLFEFSEFLLKNWWKVRLWHQIQ